MRGNRTGIESKKERKEKPQGEIPRIMERDVKGRKIDRRVRQKRTEKKRGKKRKEGENEKSEEKKRRKRKKRKVREKERGKKWRTKMVWSNMSGQWAEAAVKGIKED